MKTKAILLLGVLVAAGCDDGEPGAAMMPAADAGSGGAAIGTGGAAGEGTGGTAGAGSGGAAGTPGGSGGTAGAGTGGAIGAGGVVGSGGAGGAQPGNGGVSGTGGAGGAAAIPACAGTIRNSGDCFNLDQTGWKKKNGYDCNINCSTIVNGTSNVGPPTGPECIFGGNRICVRSCSECS